MVRKEILVDLVDVYDFIFVERLGGVVVTGILAKRLVHDRVEDIDVSAPLLVVIVIRRVLLVPRSEHRLVCQVHLCVN